MLPHARPRRCAQLAVDWLLTDAGVCVPRSRVMRGAAVVVAGIAVLALALVVLLSRPAALPEQPQTPERPPVPALPAPRSVVGPPSTDIAEPATPSPAAAFDGVPPSDSMEENRKRVLGIYEQKIAQVLSEPPDRMWAAEMERRVLDDLRAVAADGGRAAQVLGVQCGSRTCAVAMEWSNFETARNDYSWIPTARTSYSETCSKIILLPPPADPSVRTRRSSFSSVKGRRREKSTTLAAVRRRVLKHGRAECLETPGWSLLSATDELDAF